jgi:hypothetical protein
MGTGKIRLANSVAAPFLEEIPNDFVYFQLEVMG